MAFDLLVPWRNIFFVLLPNFESWADVSHLLEDGVPPVCVTVLGINFPGFLDGLRYSYAKFVRANPVLRLHLRNNAVPLLKGVRCPPSESGFVLRNRVSS